MLKGLEVKIGKTPTQGSKGGKGTDKLSRSPNQISERTHRLPVSHDAHVASVQEESRRRIQE